MNLFDASDPKPAPGKDPPPAGGPPPADRLPKEVLQGFPGLESAVRPPLYQRILLWFVPNLTAFIASFCIMVIEVVASRVIARYLGSSLYTWTSVIGIVLLGITLGNLLGGRLADWFRPAAVLAVLFLLASGACVAIPMANDWVNDWNWKPKPGQGNWFVWTIHYLSDGGKGEDDRILLPWSGRIFGHVLVVFLLPSTVLGTIGPVVAKMALDQGRKPGSTLGNVYAWGAAGSIVGTFFTGFYLIAKLGTVATFLAVGVVLCVVGIVYCLSLLWSSARPREALTAFFAVFWALGVPVVAFYGLLEYWGVFEGKAWRFEWVNRGGETVLRERADPEQDILYLDESQYSFIKIDRNKVENEGETKETQRDLVLDNLIHAHYVPGNPTKLEYEYEDIYKAITHRCQPTGEAQGKLKALFIGGGGYVFPRYLRAVWPECYVEVAEIDPAVTRADITAFGLDKTVTQIVKSPADLKRGGNPFWIYHLDARNHVEDLIRRKDTGETVPEFDFIYGDAFNDYAVPFHLTTREFNEKVKRLLKPESGVYLINIIDVFDAHDPVDLALAAGLSESTIRKAKWRMIFDVEALSPWQPGEPFSPLLYVPPEVAEDKKPVLKALPEEVMTALGPRGKDEDFVFGEKGPTDLFSEATGLDKSMIDKVKWSMIFDVPALRPLPAKEELSAVLIIPPGAAENKTPILEPLSEKLVSALGTRGKDEDLAFDKKPTALFLGAAYNTFCETFGEDKVYVFCCNKDEPSTGRDTYIVAGSLRALELGDLPTDQEPYKFDGSRLNAYHLKILTNDRHAGTTILTDDKAPVENLLRFVVNSRKW